MVGFRHHQSQTNLHNIIPIQYSEATNGPVDPYSDAYTAQQPTATAENGDREPPAPHLRAHTNIGHRYPPSRGGRSLSRSPPPRSSGYRSPPYRRRSPPPRRPTHAPIVSPFGYEQIFCSQTC